MMVSLPYKHTSRNKYACQASIL